MKFSCMIEMFSILTNQTEKFNFEFSMAIGPLKFVEWCPDDS